MELTEASESLTVPDLAESLGYDGLRSLLKLMCDAYFDLLKSGFVQEDTPENYITEEWFIRIQLRYKKASISVVPLPQKEDTTKGKKGKLSPTIDFCFRSQHFPESYFGAECKLMDEGNRRHLREYMNENGLGRFLDGRYASYSSAGAMIGYVRVGDPEVVAVHVAQNVSALPDKPQMIKAKPLGSFEDIYQSHHNRSDGISPFLVFHLFYGFASAYTQSSVRPRHHISQMLQAQIVSRARLTISRIFRRTKVS